MSLNLELWIAMAAAALFYHYASIRKASTAAYVLASVTVSVLVMLIIVQGWAGILIGQLLLFGVIFAYEKLGKGR